MPTIGDDKLPYPSTSDEPNIPKDIQSLASATSTALKSIRDSISQNVPKTNLSKNTSYRVKDAVVHLVVDGEQKQSAAWSNRTVGTLPAELVPPNKIAAAATTTNGPKSVSLEVDTDGTVKLNTFGGAQGDDTATAYVTWKI